MYESEVKYMKKIKEWLFPLSMWLLWGMTYGFALKSAVLGISLGFVMAVAFNMSRDEEHE